VFGDLPLEVESELVVEFALGGTRPEEGPQAEQ
jgi:hypothetical protein